jgi:trigger factor
VEEGDVAVVNVRVEGEEGEGRTFMTVVGQTFPQMDQALMGMKVEEMKHVNLTFPENFQEKDWAGKPLSCVVTISSLSAVQMPALDEEFAKSLKTENVDELKHRLRDTIARAKESMIQDMMNRNLLNVLLERSTVHVPDNMWESIAARRLQETAMEQRQKGKTMEEYAQENDMSVEQLVENWKEVAHNEVKRAILIREVFTRENMKLNERDLNQELFSMAQEYEIQPEELVGILKKNNQIEEIQFRAIARKVTDYLREKAEIKEVAMA